MDKKGIHGSWRMQGKARKTSSMLFIVACFVAPLWGHQAFAAWSPYDEFSSGSINPTLWTTNFPDNMLSVVTGTSKGVGQPYVVHAAGTGSSTFPNGRLTTTSTFSGDFHAGINFFNFSSTGYLPVSIGEINPSITLAIGNFGSSDNYFIVSRIPLHNDNGTASDAIGWREYDHTGTTIIHGGSVGPYVYNPR